MCLRAKHLFLLEQAMQTLTSFASAIAVALCAASLVAPSGACAADLGAYQGARQEAFQSRETYQNQSAPHRQFYVRGDIGIGHHGFGGFSQSDLIENSGAFATQAIGDTVYLAAGLGWQINPRIRLDFTGEYRSTADVKALDNLTGTLTTPDGTLQANTLYNGHLTAVVGLANGYYDMFSWRGFTPYVGAGAGFAHTKMSSVTTLSNATFTDTTTGDQALQHATGYSNAKSQTNFAWALMAGTSYDLSANAKLDIGYRYLNMGAGTSTSTDLLNCTCGTIGAPLKISDLEAHEIKIGVRWMLGNDPALPAPYQPLK
jgi:opacity protein-like surface antigen